MKCDKCKKNIANVKYTQIINGEKEELNLCEQCAQGMGINNFSMPINFSDFFGEFLQSDISNAFSESNYHIESRCKKCGMTFEEFASIGKFGCDNCYAVFNEKIDRILKGIHGTEKHVGRKLLNVKEEQNEKEEISKHNSQILEIERLKNKLKQLIKDENYEEAAKVRDEIKKLEGVE